MRTARAIAIIGAIAASTIAGAAAAKDLTVIVDTASYPWNRAANPQYPFGLNDGKPPKTVYAPWPLAGLKIHFKATGQMFIQTEFGSTDPDGLSVPEAGLPREAQIPSHYTSNAGGSARIGALLGAFIDADGKVIGRPFVIGREYEAQAPDGTAAITMGTNDDRYRDNAGKYTVVITIPEPNVTVDQQK